MKKDMTDMAYVISFPYFQIEVILKQLQLSTKKLEKKIKTIYLVDKDKKVN